MEKSFTTKCPKQGVLQWSCTQEECICHLKSSIVEEGIPPEVKKALDERAEKRRQEWQEHQQFIGRHPKEDSV